MLAAFHLNLTALSYIALLVGLFLVYNTVSVAVLSRRGEIGALRGLGVTRGQVRTLFLAEAAALAAVGSAGGLLIGRLLGKRDGGLDVDDGVGPLHRDRVRTAGADPVHIALAFFTGVPLSLLAALVPALEASRVPADGGDAGRRPGGRSRPLPGALARMWCGPPSPRRRGSPHSVQSAGFLCSAMRRQS